MRLIVGPSQPLADALQESSRRHDGGRLRIVVAWAREEGVLWLIDAIQDRAAKLQVVVGVNERGTTVEALLRLLKVADQLWVYHKHPRQTFHPKLYAFEGGAAGQGSLTLYVGSSNLTTGGLRTNFEASLSAGPRSDNSVEARAMKGMVDTTWRTFTTGSFAHRIKTAGDVETLYRGGYVVTEQTIRAQATGSAPVQVGPSLLPTAPPQQAKAPEAGAVTIPFELDKEGTSGSAPPVAGSAGAIPRFFVRTLTANDIEKLQDRRPGTFEPDLGRDARDADPMFWGWPGEYSEVTRQLKRLEWEAAARLTSRITPPGGAAVQLMLWYREPRANHLEEHRWRLGPIGVVRSAVPDDFDVRGLVVFQRTPASASYAFDIRLITEAELDHAGYAAYLTETRAGHRFGYGPTPGV